MSKINCIGVLTSGGDSPGMNAAIRAVVRAGAYKGMKVVGIKHGYNGLIQGDMIEMGPRDVSDIIHKGGTALFTARSPEFMTPEGREKAVSMAKIYGLEGIVVIGGDGSFRGARELSRLGIPTIGVPGTIDNDISCSDYTIGFDTAVNTAMDAIRKIRDTAASHDRCSVIEVMGRHAGHIALYCGIAGGAEVIMVPERPYAKEDVIKTVMEANNRGKKRFIVVVAEGIGGANEIAKEIEAQTGIESRATILGYIQRGGSPTVTDIVVASEMGAKSVELLSEGIGNRVIAMKDNKVVDYDIEEALNMKKEIDDNKLSLAKILGI